MIMDVSIITINIIFEDLLSEAVISRLLIHSGRHFLIGTRHHAKGNGAIKRNISGFNKAAKGMPYLVLTDCDNYSCAPSLIHDYLKYPKHPNLIFRVAVNEVEAWLLADREGFANYLGVSVHLIPENVDNIDDPKRHLINIARSCRNKELKNGIVPKSNSTATQGPYYNNCLIPFVNHKWNIDNAILHSDSLRRALKAIVEFNPQT